MIYTRTSTVVLIILIVALVVVVGDACATGYHHSPVLSPLLLFSSNFMSSFKIAKYHYFVHVDRYRHCLIMLLSLFLSLLLFYIYSGICLLLLTSRRCCYYFRTGGRLHHPRQPTRERQNLNNTHLRAQQRRSAENCQAFGRRR